MHRKLFLLIIVITVALIVSCKLFEKEDPKQIEVYGCMDSTATNYKPDATVDDGSCDYCKEGSSFLLISTDGGNTWEFNCPQDFNIMLTEDIAVIDSNHIWIINSKSSIKNELDQILFTSDQGKTWEAQFTFPYQGNDGGAGYLEMFDENNGIAMASWMGAGPKFFVTNDGQNWNMVKTPDTEGRCTHAWRKIDFIDTSTGYFLNTHVYPKILYKTTNLGEAWETTEFEENIILLKFYDENIGLLIGLSTNYRTTDGAQTWEELSHDYFNDGFWGRAVQFLPTDPSKVWLTGSNSIYFSADTGRTWTKQTYPKSNDDLYLYNDSAWLAGNGLHFTNSPQEGHWEPVILPDIGFPIAIFSDNIDGYKDEIIVTTGSF